MTIDRQNDPPVLVIPGCGLVVLHTVNHPPQLLQIDRRSVTVGHHQLAVGRCLHQLGIGLNGIGLPGTIQCAGGQLDIACADGVCHLINADLACSQFPGIKQCPYRVLLGTKHIDLGHTVDGGDPAGDHGLGILVNPGERQGW